MTYRYALHPRGLVAIALAAVTLLVLARRAGPVYGPMTAGIAASLLLLVAAIWLAQRQRASGLGAVRIDDDAVRRLRANGRVAETLRWDELRAIVLDRRARLLLFQGANAIGIHCSGPGLLGGVGLERFRALLREIPRRTQVPILERGAPGRTRAEAPERGAAAAGEPVSATAERT